MPANKYVSVALTSARQRLHDRGALLGRVAFYALLLFVFSRLWTVALESTPVAGVGPGNFVWYLAVTEWIVLCVPHIHLEVEEEVRNGDLIYRLTRPTPYPAAKLAEALGEMLVRMPVLGAAGFLFGFCLTGALPIAASSLVLLIPVALLAACLNLVFLLIVGLTSFWLHDCRPLYWVWQKCGFVLGGLMIPLSLYPDWLRTIARASPFAAMLHGPGQLVLGGDPRLALTVMLELLAWLGAALALMTFVYDRALRRVCVGGG